VKPHKVQGESEVATAVAIKAAATSSVDLNQEWVDQVFARLRSRASAALVGENGATGAECDH
jgi:hypothetical protein